MDGKRLIEKIRLRNILSFGDKGEEIELQPLNIIIGQNASGKSNLVDVIKLLRSLPIDKGLADFISENGGIGEWIWKGRKNDKFNESAEITVLFKDLEYSLRFGKINTQLDISYEHIKPKNRFAPITSNGSFNSNNIGTSMLAKLSDYEESISETTFEEVAIFFKRVIGVFSKLVAYTDLQLNRNSKIRNPQILSSPKDFLSINASNLFLILKDLEQKDDAKVKIIESLKKFNSKIVDYTFESLAEYIFLSVEEEGLESPISALRLSDGTLRYLCLLTILCHPEPPPLICIEEPETGLHPDILPTIAELMKEASQRTQLIVTTHSDILVSAFSDMPEAVLVCEKDEDGTHFKRLEKDKLKEWLDEYSLGDLWLKGEIGGTRW